MRRKKIPTNLREKLVEWGNKYPWDVWWRLHHNAPFGSPEHKAMNMAEMAAGYIEYVLLEVEKLKYKKKIEAKDRNSDEELFGKSLEVPKMKENEVDEIFNLDMNDFEKLIE